MVTNNIEKRLTALEERRPQQDYKPLAERIAKYKRILDTEDYESEDGRALKATIDRYANVIDKIEGDEMNNERH